MMPNACDDRRGCRVSRYALYPSRVRSIALLAGMNSSIHHANYREDEQRHTKRRGQPKVKRGAPSIGRRPKRLRGNEREHSVQKSRATHNEDYPTKQSQPPGYDEDSD
jgi:hypothetical protein